jgi:5-methyltetrahydropteroyltriglutamate--homocysteine methyltransferase
VSVECRNSKVPLSLRSLLAGKDTLVGATAVATDTVEAPEAVGAVAHQVLAHVPKQRIVLCTNCGMAPMRRDIAYAKLAALAKGAALARTRHG